MSVYVDHAKKLRAVTDPHYNCCQSVIVCFAKDAGLTEEKAFALASHFGGGMFRASACGAITGGLMALGLLGAGDRDTLNEYYRILRERHDGYLDCADLLRVNKERGGEKKPHCDAMVYECTALVEQLARERGLL